MPRSSVRRRVCLAFLLAAALRVCAQAQEPSQSDVVIKLSTEIVVTDAQVLSKRTGRILGGLKREDFLLYEDGVKQEITYFSQDKLPLSIVLLLDVSGSVRRIIQQIQAGAVRALQHLKPEDEVAVMAFATRAALLQDFTRDRQLIAEQTGKASDDETMRRTGGSTSLNEAVYQAAAHLDKAANPISRRVVIAVTDNISNQLPFMGHSEKEAFEQLFESGSVVCGIIVRDAFSKVASVSQKSPTNILFRKIMSFGSVGTYAEKTGGEVMKADGDEVNLTLAKLIDHLRTRYSLGYAPSNSQMDGKFRKIKVTVSREVEKREGQVVVKTKQGYYARRRSQAENGQGKQPHR
jgi:VWFA-related protein